jgi:GDP-4-dehydro-6-deoxy-D-mannose reductase
VSGRRVLVTGAGGFVGLHLIQRLAQAGHAVLALGIDTAPARARVPLAGEWDADLRDLDAVASGIGAARPDAVVHLAAQSSAARSFEDPVSTFQVNVLGTWNLLEAVRRAAPAARVLCVGTGDIYGPQPEGSRVAEEAPLRPVNPYALSKAAADLTAEMAARVHGLDVIRTRSFGHTGPGQTDRFVVPSLARQIAAIEAGRAQPVIRVGNLEVTRDLCDVRDVVEAYRLLLERGRTGCAYNVCRGEAVRLTEVARELTARARVPVRVEVDPSRMRPTDLSYLVGDPGLIERELGWRAQIPLARTLEDILQEWRADSAD